MKECNVINKKHIEEIRFPRNLSSLITYWFMSKNESIWICSSSDGTRYICSFSKPHRTRDLIWHNNVFVRGTHLGIYFYQDGIFESLSRNRTKIGYEGGDAGVSDVVKERFSRKNLKTRNSYFGDNFVSKSKTSNGQNLLPYTILRKIKYCIFFACIRICGERKMRNSSMSRISRWRKKKNNSKN